MRTRIGVDGRGRWHWTVEYEIGSAGCWYVYKKGVARTRNRAVQRQYRCACRLGREQARRRIDWEES